MRSSPLPEAVRPDIPGRGSVEHFYHFILSYFLPLDRYISKHHPDALLVRTCGPMDAWFDLLDPATKIVTQPVSRVDPESHDHSQTSRSLRSFENRLWNRKRLLAAGRASVLTRLGCALSPVAQRVTLVNRAPSLPFYLDEAEVTSSGAGRRSIPNIQALAEAIRLSVSVDVFEGEHLAPAEQVRRLSQTSILIGQHGAGLVHMIWMASGGVVIEILPQDIGGSQRGLFRVLARACGHSYVAISQEGSHAPVDVSEVIRVLSDRTLVNRRRGAEGRSRPA